MKRAAREVTLANGARLAIRGRLGTVVYRFFDGDRDFEGAVYYVEPLHGVEFALLEGAVSAAPANDFVVAARARARRRRPPGVESLTRGACTAVLTARALVALMTPW